MKEGSNNGDKTACLCQLAEYTTLNSCTYDQQLPIKVRKERLQPQVLIEKKASLYGRYSFQSNMPVPV